MFLISCRQYPGRDLNPRGICMKTLSGRVAWMNALAKSTEHVYQPRNRDKIRKTLTVLNDATGELLSWMSFIRSPRSTILPLYFVTVPSGLCFNLKTHWDGIIEYPLASAIGTSFQHPCSSNSLISFTADSIHLSLSALFIAWSYVKISGLFFAPAALIEMGQLKALNSIPKWESGAIWSGSLKADISVAEATNAVCPDGSRMSRLKRTRVDRLGGVLGVLDGTLVGTGFGAGFGAKGTAGVDGDGVGGATVGEVGWCRLPFDWGSGSEGFCKGVGVRKSDSRMGWMEDDWVEAAASIGLAVEVGLRDVTSPQVLECGRALTKEPGAAEKDGGSRGWLGRSCSVASRTRFLANSAFSVSIWFSRSSFSWFRVLTSSSSSMYW